jgi:hypothetical protein
MGGVLQQRVDEARSIERQLRQGADKIVSRNFGKVAKVLWPFKTAAHLASIASTNERTAARWLSGEFEPPYCIVEAVMHETFARD